jgi:hypothetical protein
MTMAVNLNASKTSFIGNAREAFGDALPDWVEALAGEADRTTGTAAGNRIGYKGGSIVTSICRANYNGDWSAVEARVRGALMGEEVCCPVLGEIARDHCLDEQKKRHIGTSQTRTALFHACRGGCAHSRIKTEGGAA